MDVDLDAAVAAGIINEEQALSLRTFEASRAAESHSTAEKFRLFGGLNDVVSALGVGLLATGAGTLLNSLSLQILYLVFPVAATFIITRISPRHKPFLTAALLTGSLAAISFAMAQQLGNYGPRNVSRFVFLGICPALAYGLYFWRQTRFPPVPAAMAAVVMMGVAACAMPTFNAPEVSHATVNIALLATGACVLIWAVWWDLTDVRRETERSQIAFWLHCCAGVAISRSSVALVTGRNPFESDYTFGLGGGQYVGFLVIIGAGVAVSLLLDRRTLVIGLIVPTIIFFHNLGSEVAGMIIVGASILLFTYFWNSWRRALLSKLPTLIAAQLPRTDIVHVGQRPTRRRLELQGRSWPRR